MQMEVYFQLFRHYVPQKDPVNRYDRPCPENQFVLILIRPLINQDSKNSFHFSPSGIGGRPHVLALLTPDLAYTCF